MIRISICFFCKNFLRVDEEEIEDEYGLKEKKVICKAYPEGVPKLKLDADDVECAKGFYYEKAMWE